MNYISPILMPTCRSDPPKLEMFLAKTVSSDVFTMSFTGCGGIDASELEGIK